MNSIFQISVLKRILANFCNTMVPVVDSVFFSIFTFWRPIGYLQLKIDEVFAALKHLEREGIPSDKQFKILKKISDQITLLKENCKKVEKDIAPIVQRESDIYQKKIAEFEEVLKALLVA